MATKTFHLSIPEYMQPFVDERIKERFHKSLGSYVQELIRQDQLRAEKVKLTNMLLVGLASKKMVMTKNEWRKLEGEVVENMNNKK